MRFILSFIIAFACVTTFAAKVNIHEKDIKKIEEAIANPDNTYTKMTASIAKNLVTTDYKTFADMQAMVVKEVAALTATGYKGDRLKDREVINTKLCCQTITKFRKNAFDLAKAYPQAYDVGMYLNWPEHGLSDAELYNVLITYLLKFNDKLQVSVVNKAIDRIIEISSVANINNVKTDLQKLNRIYSMKVLKDQETWEPVVSKIRTILDTY